MPFIVGIVEGGFGSAQHDVRKGYYDVLPYEPYPGTLNLGVKEWPELPEPDFRITFKDSPDLKLWAATVCGIECHLLMVADASLELLSPVRLRDALKVENGDTVLVKV